MTHNVAQALDEHVLAPNTVLNVVGVFAWRRCVGLGRRVAEGVSLTALRSDAALPFVSESSSDANRQDAQTISSSALARRVCGVGSVLRALSGAPPPRTVVDVLAGETVLVDLDEQSS